ncbi:50S ribosomal protein L4 [candidate division KSB1 bacterium]|jgi:large subunit ribosomal protein L4|nr:50S ribosomal protein L4 [candidate division KSB1 bacterium]
MEMEILKKNGSSSGAKVKLPDDIFNIDPNENAVYLTIKAQNANTRQGTASTKTRSMVSGGGRKPFKQKGRGAARAGTIRSPLWVGGGRVFGPQPRDYNMRLPRRVKLLARKSAFSDKAKNDKIKIIEDFKLEQSKTKEVFSILKSLGLDNQKTLLLLSDYDADILRAGKNIPKLEIRVARTESTYDLLKCDIVLIQQGAVDKLAGGIKE